MLNVLVPQIPLLSCTFAQSCATPILAADSNQHLAGKRTSRVKTLEEPHACMHQLPIHLSLAWAQMNRAIVGVCGAKRGYSVSGRNGRCSRISSARHYTYISSLAQSNLSIVNEPIDVLTMSQHAGCRFNPGPLSVARPCRSCAPPSHAQTLNSYRNDQEQHSSDMPLCSRSPPSNTHLATNQSKITLVRAVFRRVPFASHKLTVTLCALFPAHVMKHLLLSTANVTRRNLQ